MCKQTAGLSIWWDTVGKKKRPQAACKRDVLTLKFQLNPISNFAMIFFKMCDFTWVWKWYKSENKHVIFQFEQTFISCEYRGLTPTSI